MPQMEGDRRQAWGRSVLGDDWPLLESLRSYERDLIQPRLSWTDLRDTRIRPPHDVVHSEYRGIPLRQVLRRYAHQ